MTRSAEEIVEKALLMAVTLAKNAEEGMLSIANPEELLYDKPTDIIGFSEIGRALAQRLDATVGHKEICYFSYDQNAQDFHFWPFKDMLEKSEFMFITTQNASKYLDLFDDLSKFNHHIKIIIMSDGFEKVAARLVEKCERGELGGVAFESDDLKILNRKYEGNVFVSPR